MAGIIDISVVHEIPQNSELITGRAARGQFAQEIDFLVSHQKLVTVQGIDHGPRGP